MSTRSDQPVIFRRIHGRLVPIRVKANPMPNHLREAATGAALIGAGGATSTLAGKLYKAVQTRSVKMAGRAFNAGGRTGFQKTVQLELFALSRKKKSVELAGKLAKKAAMFETAAPIIRHSGIVGGSLLIGLGAAKLASAAQKDKNENETVNRLVGAGAATLAFHSQSASKFMFKAGMFPKASIKDALAKVTPYLKRLHR
jgi:hypothetical protein